MNAVCVNCGRSGLYREIEVVTDGWRDLEVTYLPDGTLEVSESHIETNSTDWEEHDRGNYACADCGHTAGKLEDLVARPDIPGLVCCCGHDKASHPEQRPFDAEAYTRGRMSCSEVGCGCWEFETDPALATVVRGAVAA